MSTAQDFVTALAALLRTSRQARGLTVASLATQVGVSARLVSEFERGKRPHVSLDTAMRLLHCVGAPLQVSAGASRMEEFAGRAERAARRRQTWLGSHTTLEKQSPPAPPSQSAARVMAVAVASQLAAGLQAAHRGAHRSDAKPRGLRPTR